MVTIKKSVLTGLLLAAAFTAGCDSGSEAAQNPLSATDVATTTAVSTTPLAEPQTVEAAKALAERQVEAFAAGDYAGTWDMWSAAGKAAISREEYTRIFTECREVAGGVPITVKTARLENPTTAVVTIDRLGFGATYTVLYEDGAWRWQPSADSMADFAKGADVIIAERRSRGSCA